MGAMRGLCAAFASLLATAVATAALADAWPSRPITVVIPFATGTDYEFIARTVLDQVGGQIGQPFVLENRPGGGGTVGVATVVKASPDGYTLLLSSSSMSSAVILHKSLPYDALHDLAPVAMFGAEPSMLVAAPGKGYAHVSDLVAAAKANPGALKFGSVGIGSASYIAGERFRLAAGLNVQHIPYSGPGEVLNDMMAGRIDFYFVPVTPALPLITRGKVVPLAVSTSIRLPSLSGLPTLAESGYPIAPYLIWCGLSAPAKTPHDIVNKLNEAIGKALAVPTVRTRLLRTGVLPTLMSPEQYATFFADDVAEMIELGKGAHIEPLD